MVTSSVQPCCSRIGATCSRISACGVADAATVIVPLFSTSVLSAAGVVSAALFSAALLSAAGVVSAGAAAGVVLELSADEPQPASKPTDKAETAANANNFFVT